LTAWQAKPVDSLPMPAAPPAPAVNLPVRPPAKPEVKLLAQAQPGTSNLPLTSPYSKWLNEDVVYIISPWERAAFESLRTNEEREHFIEQFWLRRDPTPGAAENKFKQEHYRRIGFANRRYPTRGIVGWKTDRGRIYIIYGPPDEIESHPAGGTYERPPSEGGGATSTFPFEQWRYHHIEGVGNNIIMEFVDPTMSGEYRMTRDPKVKETLVAGANQTGATVQAQASGTVISIPLQIFGDHRVNVFGLISDGVPHVVQIFDEPVQGPAPMYTKSVKLPAGSYRLNIVVKDLTGGTVATDVINFEVK